jgi:glutamate dehydrogenase (NAD(P)+)
VTDSVIIVALDGEKGTKGYFVIDASVNGRSYGGVRIALDLTPEILQRVARAKTLKYGFLGLPVGGAKAGICADPYMPVEQKRELLRKFGESISSYLKEKSFVPCEDIGTTKSDIRYMLTSNGVRVLPRSLTGQTRNYTGMTVYIAGVRAALQIGIDASRASVAVEGFGSVGSAAAMAFWRGGARVVGVSTIRGAVYDDKGLDVGELIKLYESVGDRAVEVYPAAETIQKESLAGLDVDIFSPCAHPDSINAGNAASVKAKIVCPGANCPVAPEADRILFERGILSVPDIIASCGGVLGASMRRAGVQEKHLERYLDVVVGEHISKLLTEALREKEIPGLVAERIAEKRFEKVKAQAESKSIYSRAFKLGLELYRTGIIPYRLVAPIAPYYFRKKSRGI